MKAALYFLIFAVVQSTYGYDQNIQMIVDSENSIYTSFPDTITQIIRDFLEEVDSMFDSVMDQSLTTSNYDLICYLNAQAKYEQWYTNMATHCTADREYALANLTFWHEKFLAEMPKIDQLFAEAKSIVATRAGCGPTDLDTYASSLGTNLTYPSNTFYQLQNIGSYSYGLVPVDMLYGLSNELSMIFSYAQNDPTYDAVGAIEDAEFKHLTVDSMTIITACDYAKWYIVGSVYSYYTSILETMRHMLVDQILRGANEFECTGQ